MSTPTLKTLSGPELAAIRGRLHLSQTAFWKPLGVPQSSGACYELGHRPLPHTLRLLAWMHYVAGIPVDAEPRLLLDLGRTVQRYLQTASKESARERHKAVIGAVRETLAADA